MGGYDRTLGTRIAKSVIQLKTCSSRTMLVVESAIRICYDQIDCCLSSMDTHHLTAWGRFMR